VFIVTSGEYSDYGIHSVWSTREAAEAAASGWGEVEEWILDTEPDGGEIQWHAWVDGITGEMRVADKPDVTNNPSPTVVYPPATRRWDGKPRSFWAGHGYGRTPEHARKSLADAIAKAKAEANEPSVSQQETPTNNT
jgi:hypothetical protein